VENTLRGEKGEAYSEKGDWRNWGRQKFTDEEEQDNTCKWRV